MVDISIIIVNYNTVDLTTSCIESIYSSVNSSCEIIVVDNNSSDGSVQILSQKFPSLTVISSDINLGFGRANNLGAAHARGKYLFFLNSDTILHNDPFPFFMAFIEKHVKVGCVGTYLFNSSKEYVQSGGCFYSRKKYLRMALYRWINHPYPTEVPLKESYSEVDYVIGADLFVDRLIFLNTGGFDKNIFMYFEDVELCKRINNLGYKSYIIPGPQITHLVKGSSSSQFSRVHNTASLIYCLSKDISRINLFFFQLLYFLLKLPICFRYTHGYKNNIEYLLSIFNYRKYLAK